MIVHPCHVEKMSKIDQLRGVSRSARYQGGIELVQIDFECDAGRLCIYGHE